MRLLFPALTLAAVFLTSCATVPRHSFAEPAADWRSRTGQMAFSGPDISLIGDVFVRYSAAGESELRFSKPPGLLLLTIRQDRTHGQAEGPLARGGWSGRIESAPERLRGWFELRDKIIAAQPGATVQHRSGAATFRVQL